MKNIISYNILLKGLLNMVRNKNFNQGITYVIIAILCLTNLFLGASVIRKLSDYKKSTMVNEGIIDEEKIIPVFSLREINENKDIVSLSEGETENETNLEKIESEKEVIDSDFFLRVLLKSNAYMKTAYEMKHIETGLESSKFSFFSRLAVLLKPDFYIKPHLPAIVSAFNDTYSWESDNIESDSIPELEGYIVLSDIIFVEDPAERYELNQELELMGKKHDDKLYIEAPKV